MLAGIYEHRLLSIHSPRRLSLWFITDAGADAVEAGGARVELRRRVTSHEQAEGPLKKHTIAVNQVGVEFVRAATERDDECGPGSWRNEVAHPISQARGRRPGELVIADALLTYLQTSSDGALALHQRFIELDRGILVRDQAHGVYDIDSTTLAAGAGSPTGNLVDQMPTGDDDIEVPGPSLARP